MKIEEQIAGIARRAAREIADAVFDAGGEVAQKTVASKVARTSRKTFSSRDKVLGAIREHPGLRSEELQKMARTISVEEVRRVLGLLRRERVVRVCGKARGTRYFAKIVASKA